MKNSAVLMAVGAGFRSASTKTSSVVDDMSTQPSLTNTGVDNVAAITGSDVSIAWAVTCGQLRFPQSHSAGLEEGV